MIENPVRRPMVPPIADSMSTNFADLSYKKITNWYSLLTCMI